MKNYFVAVFILFFVGCKSKSDSAATVQKKVDSPSVTPAKKAPAYPQGFYKWTGSVKDIPVFMWFVARDGVMKGELTYLNTKSRKPIMVIGLVSDTEIVIKEFKPNGDVTGIFSGRIFNNNFKGTWWGVATDDEFPFALKIKDTLLNAIDTSMAANGITGIYTFAHKPNGSQGGMTVDEVSGDVFSFDMSCVTPGPSYNIAQVETDTVVISHNAFVYELKDAPNCEFRIRFFKGFAVVDFPHERYDCAFGMNATVEGIFLKGGIVNRVNRE